MAKILITGGSGRLGRVIQELATVVAPTHKDMDILDYRATSEFISKENPDIVIHCAAYTNSLAAEQDKQACWKLNVEGTRNIVKACTNSRLVYISSDYVFDGERGNYSEEDIPNPINFYGLTKLCGEMLVSQHQNSLIIRTGFKDDGKWAYDAAFIDQWTSSEPATVFVGKLLKAANHFITGILHIGGERRKIYDYALDTTPNVSVTLRGAFNLPIPRDVSFDTRKWQKLF